MDILATLCGQVIRRRRFSNIYTSQLSLGKAVELMKLVANKSLSTTALIQIELSKVYLHRALRRKDSESDSIYCLANVYLAVLYYTTGQYQTAIDRCTLVTRSQDHSQCGSHVVQGDILPKIDDDVDNVLGLAVFYQHVRTAALNHQPHHMQYVSVFTTELFAYYLHIKYMSLVTCYQYARTSDEFKLYRGSITDAPQLFIGDVLLFLSESRLLKFQHKPISLKSEHTLTIADNRSASDLVELLQRSAVEHLTAFRRFMARDFGSVVTIVTTDFEALYAYKRGEYQRCLQLSIENLRTPWYGCNMPMFFVPTHPQFIPMLDDDIVSLTALTTLVDCRSRCYSNRVCISSLTLSLYLTTQCQLKLHYSVTSLAQTLDYIKVAQRRLPAVAVLDQLTLKLIERKVRTYSQT